MALAAKAAAADAAGTDGDDDGEDGDGVESEGCDKAKMKRRKKDKKEKKGKKKREQDDGHGDGDGDGDGDGEDDDDEDGEEAWMNEGGEVGEGEEVASANPDSGRRRRTGGRDERKAEPRNACDLASVYCGVDRSSIVFVLCIPRCVPPSFRPIRKSGCEI